jgi:hypothetical protein
MRNSTAGVSPPATPSQGMFIAKTTEKHGEPHYREIVKVGRVSFDPRDGWVLLSAPIGARSSKRYAMDAPRRCAVRMGMQFGVLRRFGYVVMPISQLRLLRIVRFLIGFEDARELPSQLSRTVPLAREGAAFVIHAVPCHRGKAAFDCHRQLNHRCSAYCRQRSSSSPEGRNSEKINGEQRIKPLSIRLLIARRGRGAMPFFRQVPSRPCLAMGR